MKTHDTTDGAYTVTPTGGVYTVTPTGGAYTIYDTTGRAYTVTLPTSGTYTVTLPTGNSPLGSVSPTNINHGPSPFSKWKLAEYKAAIDNLSQIVEFEGDVSLSEAFVKGLLDSERLVCECGAAACGFTEPGLGHSAWCPLHIA